MRIRLGLSSGALSMALTLAAPAMAQTRPVPRLVSEGGRHALLVDGQPFLMLGAQVNNSSNYPWALPKIWPVIDRLHANTVEVPVAWQQVEPKDGQFDFSWPAALLKDARAHGKRLVLLWFGAYKNTAPGYVPDWVKLDNQRFPRMKKPDGTDSYALSPMFDATLDADKRAFVKLMTWLKANDAQNTVIMVQVENETGSYGNPRDYGAKANALFAGPVPATLATALDKKPGTWSQLFGEQADRAFNTWYVARYVDALASAGKAVKPLPMYVNAALAGAFEVPKPMAVSSGGPQWDVLPIWKAGAPAIDFAAPDIYDPDAKDVAAYLAHYDRPDNALMVPEIGNSVGYARFFYEAVGRGAIGFSPFGMDATKYANFPLGAPALGEDQFHAFAQKYAVFADMDRQWAALAFRRPTWGAAKPEDGADQSTVMGGWKITASYGQWQFGSKDAKTPPPPWAKLPIGGCAVAQLSADQFLVTGDHVRVSFDAAPDTPSNGVMVRVEQGHYGTDGAWVMDRIWNGDQTDYGLNLVDEPVLLKVTMGRYR